MKKLIVVADWAGDALTVQEVRSAVEGFAKDPTGLLISFVASTPSTIHTSFLLSQIIQTEERFGRALETVIFQNTDPRIDVEKTGNKIPGSTPLIAKLISGIYVCGPNSGFAYSLIKKNIDELFTYKDLETGSQFRSRDLYASISAHLISAMEDEMELEEVSTTVIPELDQYYVGHVDSFGNIKSTIPLEVIKEKHKFGDTVKVSLNNVEKPAKFVTNLFGGNPGELVIYPGSSGPKDNPFLEVTIWRTFTETNPTTGIHTFNHPKPGQEVRIE